mmetsp:Transcript_18872/g.40644  ORF Transcript_18872/g.40644 Transcript_18872/m.40644 type:complete len:214 (+) Transcript_18872:409-1050(+)
MADVQGRVPGGLHTHQLISIRWLVYEPVQWLRVHLQHSTVMCQACHDKGAVHEGMQAGELGSGVRQGLHVPLHDQRQVHHVTSPPLPLELAVGAGRRDPRAVRPLLGAAIEADACRVTGRPHWYAQHEGKAGTGRRRGRDEQLRPGRGACGVVVRLHAQLHPLLPPFEGAGHVLVDVQVGALPCRGRAGGCPPAPGSISLHPPLLLSGALSGV